MLHHVDDVFSIVRKAYPQQLPDHINNLHPQTQFTKGEENNSNLLFLDTLVQRNYDKTISVKIYRKPTHTKQYLKYTSHNPTSAKQSVITALFDRADNVVSNEKDKIEEKHHILAALQQNGYLKEFIQRTAKKHNRRKEQPREHPEEELKQTKSINLLPYIQGVSEQPKRALNKHNMKAIFYTQTTLRSRLSKSKDPIPKEDRNNAVYQLNCKDCEAICVQETKRTSNIRTEQHITAIKHASKRVTLQNTAGNTIMTLTGNIRKYWTLRKTGKQEPSRKQSTQKKTSIMSMEYPSSYQLLRESIAKKTTAKTTTPSN